VQFAAVYAAGAHTGPYTTLISASFTTVAVADAGPNSRPLISTSCPPSVFAFRLPAPEMLKSVGGKNDVVCVDALLDWPPTVTVHLWLRPTPTTPKHDTHLCATGSRVQLVAVRTRLSLDDVYVTTRGDPAGPKFVPTSVTFDTTPIVDTPSDGSTLLPARDVIAGARYENVALAPPPTSADTPLTVIARVPSTPDPAGVVATTVVVLHVVRFSGHTPMVTTTPTQLAANFVPVSTTVSPPTVTSCDTLLAVVTTAVLTNGGVVSMITAYRNDLGRLDCPASVAVTLYVTPRPTVVLHRATVCAA